MTCEKCRFYQPIDEKGECRIHAPGSSNGFPIIKAGDWCGDFVQRVVPQEPSLG